MSKHRHANPKAKQYDDIHIIKCAFCGNDRLIYGGVLEPCEKCNDGVRNVKITMTKLTAESLNDFLREKKIVR